MKICSRCKIEKPYDAFYTRNDIANGYRSHCIDCEKVKGRSESTKRWRSNAKIKLVKEHGGKCVDCGFEGLAICFDFDHRDPSKKSFGISRYKGGIDGLRAEAAKCDLVCAICHRIRTHKQRCKQNPCDICGRTPKLESRSRL